MSKIMKKLLTMVAAVSAALFFTKADAQVRTYFEDSFSPDGPSSSYWNDGASTNIPAAGGPIYLVGLSDGSVVGGWVYDPEGGIIYNPQTGGGVATTPLDGEYLFVTQPITLESGAVENIFSFDYLYMALDAATADTKNFGLKVRETGGEWATVSTVYEAGASLAVEDEGTMTATLPAEYAGKEVELALFCENSDDVSFAFLFNNVVFAAWSSETRLMAELHPSLVTPENPGVEMFLRNGGTAMISSAEMSYQIGGNPVAASTLDMNLSMGEEIEETLALSVEGLTVGQVYDLKIWNSSLNGATVAEPDTMECSFRYSNGGDYGKHVPLVEVFTASWCAFCSAMNRAIDPVIEEYLPLKQVSIAKYQGNGDPYSTTEGSQRESLYGVAGYPTSIYNGMEAISSWSGTYSGITSALRERIAEDSEKDAVLSIVYDKVEWAPTAGTLFFSFTVTSAVSFSANLTPVVLEGMTTGNRGTNGEREFYHVVMDMPDGGLGKETEFRAGEPLSFDYEVNMASTNVEEYGDLELLVIVQNNDRGEVYQTASFDLPNPFLPRVDVSVEKNPISEGETYRVSKEVNPADSVFSVPAYISLENKTDESLVIGMQIRPVAPIAEGYSLQFCGFNQCYDYANIPDITLEPGQSVGIDQINDALDIQYNLPFSHVYGEPFEPLRVEVSFFDRTFLDTLSFFIDFVPVWAEDATEKLFPFDSVHFPDPIFREYIIGIADIFPDGFLSEYERDALTSIDVTEMNIESLRGIEYFTKLHRLDCSGNLLTFLDLKMNSELVSLDCSGNQLSSLDLSNNLVLRSLETSDNRLYVEVDEENRFDASTLPGFNLTRTSDWKGCSRIGYLLTFTEEEVSYRYETGYQGSATLPEVRFALVAELPEENFLPIDEEHFPDPAFRDYLKLADMNQDGQLNEDEIAGVTGIDVSGLGIQDLRGIGYFTELESLDCSDNQLTSLDLSTNIKLETLKAEGNRLDITLDDRNGFDLSTLPGFDPAKASDWEGCTRIGNLLTFTQQEVTYAYATGYAGSLAGTGLESVSFHLLADRDPSTSNENGLPTQGRVYVQDRVIHTQGLHGEISIFTPAGTLLYRGTGNRIPVGHSGVHIVRNREQVWKVFVL